jgi:site-specific recombinase
MNRIMASRWKTWLDRFAGRHSALPSLDVLASTASASQALEERLNWLTDLVQWIRRPGHDDDSQPLPEAQLRAGRLRRFLDVLEQNPEWKKSTARTLRSIVRETSALELFSETGLPRQFGLIHETGARLARRILPSPPGSAELGVIFDRLFPYRRDEVWIENLDEPTLQRLRGLLDFDIAEEEQGWNTLDEELEDSLFHLSAQLRIAGCSAAIRTRIKARHLRELPFYRLGTTLQAALDAREKSDTETLRAELNQLRAILDGCHRAGEEVLGHLEKSGVSTDVVYQLTFIEASLNRFESLLKLVFDRERPLTDIGAFVAMLVRTNRARESVVDLLRQNFRLLTQKIVERNGETGEHYIARTGHEYWQMVKRAAGGGVIMAFTTWFKIIILGWALPGLLEGLSASFNYASGFVAIQLTGSTLATKQPANTAPAIAGRMHQVRDPRAMAALVDEIFCLVRTQFASVVGNLVMVVPTILAIHFTMVWLRGAPLMSPERAVKAMHSVSILGPSFFYAGFTGVLLWASSLVAAWADNWFVCHRIRESIESDRRLIRTLGASRVLRFAQFWARNISGLGGNISFGFMLGLIPELAAFAGIPLDIRHVTLSSSMLAAAAAALGPSSLTTWPFWLGVMGIAGIGFMNVAVSFSLAIWVAIRARGIESPERHIIYQAVWARLRKQPFSIVLPLNRVVEEEDHKAGAEIRVAGGEAEEAGKQAP